MIVRKTRGRTAAVFVRGAQELKEQYTLTDLDSLAAEEKQAWLEIAQEKGAIVREMPNPGIGSTGHQSSCIARRGFLDDMGQSGLQMAEHSRLIDCCLRGLN